MFCPFTTTAADRTEAEGLVCIYNTRHCLPVCVVDQVIFLCLLDQIVCYDKTAGVHANTGRTCLGFRENQIKKIFLRLVWWSAEFSGV